MALPSLLDVVVVVALLLPGFVALAIMRSFAVIEKRLEEFEAIVWSLLLSLAIYALFGIVAGFQNFEELTARVLEPRALLLLIGLTIASGFVPGWLYVRLRHAGRRPLAGNPWDIFFQRNQQDGRDLIVFTSDGDEFKGWAGESGKEENRTELILLQPRRVMRDAEGVVRAEIPYGDSMIFCADDVRRVARLERRERVSLAPPLAGPKAPSYTS